MPNEIKKDLSPYQLLDSGGFEKLEQVGPYRLVRPAANAVWPKSRPLSEWNSARGVFTRDSSGGGKWRWNGTPLKDSWVVEWGGLKLVVKPTNFGHLGFFAEQAEQWEWLRKTAASFAESPQTLNLFAYSGGSSLAMAAGGAFVTHLDAAKGMNQWGGENLAANPDIPDNIRWITDDAMRFCQRELRRGRRYHGIVLDPPSFGRGNRGQLWKLETHLTPLLECCRDLLTENGFVLLSCHTPGYSPIVLERILESIFKPDADIESGEMRISDASGGFLPAGTFARFNQPEDFMKI